MSTLNQLNRPAGTSGQPRRMAVLGRVLHALHVGTRITLRRLRAAAMRQVARHLSRTPVPDRARPVRYGEKKAGPRGRLTLREACSHENLVAVKMMLYLILSARPRDGAYRFFGHASLNSLSCGCNGSATFASCYSDEVMADQLLNGVWPLSFKPDAIRANRYCWEQRFDAYEIKGGGALPGLRIEIEVHGSVVRLTRITFYPLDEACPVVCTPDCAASWQAAKMAALGTLRYLGQLHHHEAGCHWNMEQYYVALRRNIHPGHPLYTLLHPHLKGCMAVNRFGDWMMWRNQGALPIAAPFTSKSRARFTRDSLAQYDWKDWRPPVCLGEFHASANAGNVYWSILTEYVDRYFALNEREFVAHWHAVKGFSCDLVEHALSKSDGAPCLSPIATAGPATGMQNLKDVCRYLLYWITFENGRCHHATIEPYVRHQTRQDTVAACPGEGDLEASCDGPMETGSDLSSRQGSPHVAHRSNMRSIRCNGDGDIPTLFLRILVARKSRLHAVGYDIHDFCQAMT